MEEEGADQQELKARSLLCLYGSETGKSQELAEELGDVAERLRFSTLIAPMNDFPLKDLAQYSTVVFIISTTGQGDVPANATIFWKSLLRKKLPADCLSHLRFALFGLGDSSYEKFNWAARKLRKRILQLGANEDYPFGEGDERHDNGIDSIYLPWFQGLKSHLLKEFPLPASLTVIPDDQLLPPKYPISVAEMGTLSNPAIEQAHWEANREKHAALSHIHNPKTLDEELDDQQRRLHDMRGLGQYARLGDEGGDLSDRLTGSEFQGTDRVQLDKDNILKDHANKYDLEPSTTSREQTSHARLPIPGCHRVQVLLNERVTPKDHWQDVRRLQLKITDGFMTRLFPGDLVTIYPKNFPEDVTHLMDRMDWLTLAGDRIIWDTKGGKTRCPRDLYALADTTLSQLLLHNLDINAIPNRTFLKQLRRHTQDDREKERLLELTLEENSQEFYDYTSRPRRTILEVLDDFPGVKIPVEYALDIFPRIRGRAFSIANCSAQHRRDSVRHELEILVALVEYKTIIRKPRQGLCSRYIKSLRKGIDLHVTLSRTNLPACGERNARRPLIAIATGTGIAPIRSLIQERHTWNMPDSQVGLELLFFGCRSSKTDFYFQDEWKKLPTLSVMPAFSRDPIPVSVQAQLDPYRDKHQRLAEPVKTLSTDLIRMGPSDAPWLGSTEYDRGKMYVQHQIRTHAHAICDIFNAASVDGKNPIIMICGNAGRMPISVRHALADALVLGGLAENYEAGKERLQQVGIWMETW